MKIVAILTVFLAVIVFFMQVDIEAQSDMSISEKFQWATSFGAKGLKGENYEFGQQVPQYKIYEGAKKIDLPTPDFSTMPIEKAITQRHSVRSYKDRALTLEELSQILISADGLRSNGESPHRMAPSAGALYPIEIYVFAHNVEDVPPGLYHFLVQDTSLQLIKEGALREEIRSAGNDQRWVGAGQVTFVLTSRWDRVTVKYADRGYRYAYIEAGAICENIYLQATGLGLGTVAVGAYDDDATHELLEIDGVKESALLVMPLGVE